MKILHKYVLKELIVPFLAGFAIVLVFFFGTVIYSNISLIVSRIQQWRDVLYLIFLQTQPYILMALPSGTVFASSVAISRLSRDSELTAMRVAGASLRRIFLPVFLVGLLTSGLGYLYQEKIIVWAEKQTVAVYNKIMQAPGPAPIQSNVYFKIDQFYFYVNSVSKTNDKTTLSEIMIYESPIGKGYPIVTTAKQAVEENGVWELTDGRIYKMGSEGEAILTAKFKSLKLDLHKPIGEFFASEKQVPRTMTISQLAKRIVDIKAAGADPRTSQIEYSFKLALPWGSFILLFCVMPLALRYGKTGGFTGVLVGIFVFFFYWQAVIYSRVIGEAGGMDPMLAGWSSVIIFAAVGLFLTARMEKS